MAKPTVLITGVSGFIARHCDVEMLNAGYGVRGTVRSMHKSDEVKASLAKHADVTRLEVAVADLESDDGWSKAAAGCAYVLHVASPFPARQPKDVAFSRDGRGLASAGEDTTVRIWDAISWQVRHTLRGHTSFVGTLAFSPDSQLLASGSRDHTLKIWDAASWRDGRSR